MRLASFGAVGTVVSAGSGGLKVLDVLQIRNSRETMSVFSCQHDVCLFNRFTLVLDLHRYCDGN